MTAIPVMDHWLVPLRGLRSAAVPRDPVAILTGCLVFVLVLALPAILNDGDTLWQIRAGGWILDHHAIPRVDPFGYTAGDRAWSPHEWGAETLLAVAWRAAGMAGVMALTAAAAGVAAGLLLHYLRRWLPDRYALLALTVALANAAPSLLARPHVLAWPCLVLWTIGLLRARACRVAPPWSLLPVMLVWVNLHGSFMLGLLLPAGFLLEALLDPSARHRRPLAGWGGFLAAAWAVACLNPDGVTGVWFPIRLLGMHSLGWIGEWAPPDLSRPGPLVLTLLGLVALALSGRMRLGPVRVLMVLALVFGALTHARNGQLLGMVGVLLVTEPVATGFGLGPSRTARAAGWDRVAALLMLAALAVRLVAPLPSARTGEAFAALLDRVPAAVRGTPVLNAYELGGALIFQGVRPFIDSRADLYGDAALDRYRRLSEGDPATLRAAVTGYGIRWTIFPIGSPVVAWLDRQPGWRRAVVQQGLVVHVRTGV
jgi:hypothetical protein